MTLPDYPDSVAAMVIDDHAPTAPLADFVDAFTFSGDSNLWWRIGCGHHLNLFESALDRIAELSGDEL